MKHIVCFFYLDNDVSKSVHDNSTDGLISEQTEVEMSVGAGTYLNIPLKKYEDTNFCMITLK